MKSMTGYGKANYIDSSYELEIEVKSVNYKGFQLNINNCKELFFLEPEIKDIVFQYIKRGKIDMRINFTDKGLPEIQLDENRLKTYYNLLQKVKETLQLKDEIRLDTILKQDRVLIVQNANYSDEHFHTVFYETLLAALGRHQAMASREGEALKQFFLESVQTIETCLTLIADTIPQHKERLKENLTASVKQILQSNLDTDTEKRILVETALYIERSNITEELVRMQSHIANMKNYLQNEVDEIGKSINFILQEMQREINTISAKYNTTSTFMEVLKIKEEVEKCREQIQNVE